MSVDLYAAGWSDHHTALNFANVNFVRVMTLIGVEIDTEYGICGTIHNLADVRQRLQVCLDGARAMPELATRGPALVPLAEIPDPGTRALVQALGGEHIIECGWSDDYLERRLTELLRLVDFAIAQARPLRYS